MKFLLKAIKDKEQIESKVKSGENKLELQLMKDFLKIENVEEFYKELKEFNEIADIINIHAPLTNGENLLFLSTINLNFITTNPQKEVFFKMCELGELYAKDLGHNINLVIHNSMNLDFYKSINGFIGQIINILDEVIINYPHITVSVENICPLRSTFISVPGTRFDNVEIVNHLNSILSKKILFTVLDTTHALCSIRTLATNYDINQKEEFEKYFIENKDVIHTIHLGNCINTGTRKGEHGIGFNYRKKEDLEMLEVILNLIEKYTKDAYICLEVNEIDNDYIECKELKKTIFSIEKILNK